MDQLRGDELQAYGQNLFTSMGMTCLLSLEQARLVELDPNGSHAQEEHLEFDYLIPDGNTCFIVEITGRSRRDDVEEKYNKFRNQYNLVDRLPAEDRLWRLLNVPDEQLRFFRGVTQLRAAFLTTKLQRFDVRLGSVPNIAIFYKADCALLDVYSRSIGSYAKPHFVHRFGIAAATGYRPVRVQKDEHSLFRTENKKIASGDIGLADLYTFEISPYELLPVAQVYRRDQLPSLLPATESDYQRPLMPDKLDSIRTSLLADPDFVFPTNILVVLSSDCEYSAEDESLMIPERYGAVSIIDGQHRLFSYADASIKNTLGGISKIMVTAIQFRSPDMSEVSKYSAKTFVEINTNQTRVRPSHLDAIAYEVLGQTTARAIAAQVILKINEREGSKLYGAFDTNQTGLGFISTATVITALQAITNVEKVRKLGRAQRGTRLSERRGYEYLFGKPVDELCDADILIQRGVVCVERYFNEVASNFREDWPTRRHRRSSFQYAKMIAGLVMLLRDFIREGLDWASVRVELEAIKTNLLLLRNLENYDRLLLDPAEPSMPDSGPTASDDYRFLRLNRTAPTSIQEVRPRPDDR